MQVQIIQSKETIYQHIGRSVSAVMQCGKVKMTVSVNRGYVSEVVHNASNRAWKGYGKVYKTLDEAASNYRSKEALAMIDTIRAMWNNTEVAA